MTPVDFPPSIPIGAGFEALNRWLKSTFGWFFDALGAFISWSVDLLSGFFTEPAAGQLALIAAVAVALPLLRIRTVPVLVIAAASALLLLLQVFAGAGDWIINNLLPPAPILWLIDVTGEYADGFFVVAFLSLLAVTVLGALERSTRVRTGVVAGGWLVAVLLGWFVLPLLVTEPEALLMLLLLSLLAWLVAGWRMGLFALVALALVASVEQWTNAMDTLGLVLVASVIAVAVAVPIGVLAAYNGTVSKTVKPILDLMQTMPAFVYLIPAIFFFSIGSVPGVVATIVFAMPPGVRLTELGIRQVDKELVEAGEAFGAPSRKILTGIQFPLALPTIMAGINQVIMLSLSMVVIAGMVGAGGLGNQVYQGIARNDGALGFEAGIAVVILAIFLDRLTAAVTDKTPQARAASARS
ncbi:proline/glycine betaine ABC transporter permease [Nocardiopsis sp. CNT312]|uniref:ABC transporter permease n=1 Tax=Nocardiopsis sp. CNT312 TaxID=1137268 RepID=UPI00048BD9B8|nr:ABC transporter permease subunit [Nocardiopsis sp. CNT312]